MTYCALFLNLSLKVRCLLKVKSAQVKRLQELLAITYVALNSDFILKHVFKRKINYEIKKRNWCLSTLLLQLLELFSSPSLCRPLPLFCTEVHNNKKDFSFPLGDFQFCRNACWETERQQKTETALCTKCGGGGRMKN